MALSDLSLVTQSLLTLLRENIRTRFMTDVDAPGGAVDGVIVSSNPPNRLPSYFDSGLTFYLYHVSEDPHFKNQSPIGRASEATLATTPMALSLYYILTAHVLRADAETEPADSETEQRLMGYALKTFHDYPEIDDRTVIGGVKILAAGLRQARNRIQVILRPLQPEDTIQFWSADHENLAKLSAYYEVRVIMLEPEPPASRPAPVLSLGTYLHQLGTPYLVCTRNAVQFRLPEVAGGQIQSVTVSPARVLTSDVDWTGQSFVTGAVDRPDNALSLVGSNLRGGLARSIELSGPLLAVGGSSNFWVKGFIPLDLDLQVPVPGGASWALSYESDEIELKIAGQVRRRSPNNAAVIDVLGVVPGTYTLRLRVVQSEVVIGGQVRALEVASNEVTFGVGPRVSALVLPVSGDILRIDLDVAIGLNARVEVAPGQFARVFEGDAIQVVIDGRNYLRSFDDRVLPSLHPLQVGEFIVREVEDLGGGSFGVIDDAIPRYQIEVRTPFSLAPSLDPPSEHAVQVLINGVPTQPSWIQLNRVIP
jgi:hypothetical protein